MEGRRVKQIPGVGSSMSVRSSIKGEENHQFLVLQVGVWVISSRTAEDGLSRKENRDSAVL